ncbi:MAG: hypothetical protein A2Z98_12510 [Spirochaetes bacterium GWB1_27_13]|nr:MAG: hypothetical protein A2Z98_12510 [Spirochaetes bacterium GWB1_27_13]
MSTNKTSFKSLYNNQTAFNVYNTLYELSNPDQILREKGESITLYEKLSYDSHVESCQESRHVGLLSNEFDFFLQDGADAQEKKALDFIKDLFTNKINTEDLISNIQDTIYWGYGVTENLKVRDGLNIIYDKIEYLPHEWFGFNEDRELVFFSKTNATEGEIVDRANTTIIQYRPSYKNPYGRGKYSRIFFPVMIKKAMVKYGASYAENLGRVFLYLVTQVAENQEKKYELTKMLQEIIRSGAGVLETGDKLEHLNIDKAGSGNFFLDWVNWGNQEVSKCVLLQTLSTEQGAVGSQALGNVHYQVRAEAIEADKKYTKRFISQYIKQIVDLNYPNIKIYPELRYFEEEDLNVQRVDRDEKLTKQGLVFKKEYYEENYNLNPNHFDLGNDNNIEENPEENPTPKEKFKFQEVSEDIEKVIKIINSLSVQEKEFLGSRDFYNQADFRIFEKEKGFCEARLIGDKVYIQVAVRPQNRKEGIATNLVSEMIDKIKVNCPSAERIIATIDDENFESKTFFKKLGFGLGYSSQAQNKFWLDLKKKSPAEKLISLLFSEENINLFYQEDNQIEKFIEKTENNFSNYFKQFLNDVSKAIKDSKDYDEAKEKISKCVGKNKDVKKIAYAFLTADIIGRGYARLQRDEDVILFAETSNVSDIENIIFDYTDVNFLKMKVAMTKKEFDVLENKYKKYAFTIKGYEEKSQIESIQNMLIECKEKGLGFKEFQKSCQEKELKVNSLVYWQNIKSAQAAGRYNQMMQDVDIAPYWQYSAILDNQTRPEHAALNGFIRRYDDTFWKDWYPPNGYRCRCYVRSLSASYVRKKLGLSPEEIDKRNGMPEKGELLSLIEKGQEDRRKTFETSKNNIVSLENEKTQQLLRSTEKIDNIINLCDKKEDLTIEERNSISNILRTINNKIDDIVADKIDIKKTKSFYTQLRKKSLNEEQKNELKYIVKNVEKEIRMYDIQDIVDKIEQNKSRIKFFNSFEELKKNITETKENIVKMSPENGFLGNVGEDLDFWMKNKNLVKKE